MTKTETKIVRNRGLTLPLRCALLLNSKIGEIDAEIRSPTKR